MSSISRNSLINTINSLKNRFIFSNYVNKDDENQVKEKESEKIDVRENNDYSNKMEIDEKSKLQNRIATMKIINIMRNRNKRKKIK